jgi:hypothetical protein
MVANGVVFYQGIPFGITWGISVPRLLWWEKEGRCIWV